MKQPSKPTFKVIDPILGEKTLPIDSEATILDTLLENRIEIGHSCGGMGTCGTCRVFVDSGLKSLPPRNEVEAIRAADLGFSEAERLSCQNIAIPGLCVRIP